MHMDSNSSDRRYRAKKDPSRVMGCLTSPLLTMMCLILAAFGTARSEEEATPPLRAAVETGFPPFCFPDTQGRADGFSVELLRAVAYAARRNVEFIVGQRAEVRFWLEQGQVNAVTLFIPSPADHYLFDFTFPYIHLQNAIVIRDGERGIVSLNDLKDRRIAVVRGDHAEDFLCEQEYWIEIAPTPTFEEALRGLADSRYDAVLMPHLVALRLMQKLGLERLRVLNQPIEGCRYDLCFAVRKGDAQTLSLLTEGLAIVMADGTFQRLYRRWLGTLDMPSSRRLRVGGDHAYPPYEFLDAAGRPVGFNVDLMRAVARHAGVEMDIRLGPWSAMVRALEIGEIDAIEGMFYSEERARRFDFTAPYMVKHYVTAVRTGGITPPESLQALAEKTIAVQEGDLMDGFLASHGFRDGILRVGSQEAVLEAVREGLADCGLVVRLSALETLRRRKWTEVRLARRPIHVAESCVAVARGNQAVLSLFQEGLAAIRESGEYLRIHKKWFGAPPSTTPVEFLRRMLWILAPLAFVAVISVLGVFALRRVVAVRTRELRESEAKFRSLIESAPLPIFVQTDGRFAYVNPAACRLFGAASPTELIGQPVVERVPPEFLNESQQHLRWLEEGRPLPKTEAAFQRLDGTRVPVEVCAVPLNYEGKKGALFFAADISGPVAARKRLQNLNSLLRTIRDVNQLIVREPDERALIQSACDILIRHSDYALVLIILVDEKGKGAAWAAAGEAHYSEEIQRQLNAGELPACCRTAVSASDTDEDGRGATGFTPGERECIPIRYKDETYGYLIASAIPGLSFEKEERDLIAEIASDLAFALKHIRIERAREQAERQKEALDRQLAQAEKMEAVGRLAGGVAHDFNNLLMGIMGNVDLCREQLPPDHPVRELLDEIMRSAERSTNLTRQLLAFARRQTIVPRVFDINRAVAEMLSLLRRLIGENIELRWIPGAHLRPVKMDPGQLDQILANLCVNSRDAIADVGRIEIATAMATVDETFAAEHPDAAPGEYVLLKVSDTGCGIPPEILPHIFEPFFTTKKKGIGTGLGLSTVDGIVKQNGGFITVQSELGKETSFSIYLPAAREEETSPEKRASGFAGRLPRGSETILLVEDEPTLCVMLERFLLSLGYTVLAADSPRQAIEKVDHHAGPIHLVLTDVIMPDCSGRDMMKRLSEKRPHLRCIYMSGYTADIIAHQGVLEPGIDFIQKPVSLEELATKVRSVLDQNLSR